MKMANYKCFQCGKSLTEKSLEKRLQCPFCNSKIFYKPRKIISKVKAI
ncbi:MAG: DNA-directed RNA polymerase subunit P [archaeon]|nr:DNA-directed RNA polymerase subunit P [archaeon]